MYALVRLRARLRLPSVTVVSLLSPSFAVSLQSLSWLNRRLPSAVPPSAPQCRALHLYLTSRARTVLGMHKLIPFKLYQPPPLAKATHRINIYDKHGGGLVAENITLLEAYNNHVKPGHMLHLCDPMPPASRDVESMKAENTADEFNNYAILKAYSTNAMVKIEKPAYANEEKTKVKQWGPLKEVHLLSTSPVEYHRQMLDKAYRFVEGGRPVEVTLKMRGKKIPKKDKLTPGPADHWPWIHNHFPHLRPDFVLKAMPMGTVYVVEPVSDGRVCQWVMALPSITQRFNLTKRLFKVQQAVSTSIKDGKQAELPMALRMGLIESGDENYSLDAGVAKAADNAGEFSEGVRWGEKSMDSIPESRKERLRLGPEHLKYALGKSADDPENRYMAMRRGRKKEKEEEFFEKQQQRLESIGTQNAHYRPPRDARQRLHENRPRPWGQKSAPERYEDRRRDVRAPAGGPGRHEHRRVDVQALRGGLRYKGSSKRRHGGSKYQTGDF
jgi:hypothetical protein